MRQRRDRACFALEASESVGAVGLRSTNDFDRDVALEAAIAGAPHLAHSAGAERRDDFVSAEAYAGGQAHGTFGL
jgi:hypothetical protein